MEICPYQAKNTICAVMYKPPSMEKFISGLEGEFLEKLSDEVEKDLVLMGDFNANVISLKPCKYTRKLLQTTRLHGFTQVIKGPTSMTEHTSTAIDLIFVNNLHRFVSYGVQEYGANDHSVVLPLRKAAPLKHPLK